MELIEKREKADGIQKMFNEWIIERRGDLFKEFMKKEEVKHRIEEIRN